MKIVIKNEYGSFEMGGGSHKIARVENIIGLGPPTKEAETIVFSGEAGQLTKNVRDLSRTITITFDFFGGQADIERLYRIIYYPVELLFTFGDRRRKIEGRCINPEEVERIIFGKFYRVVIQFSCDSPYFKDFYNTEIAVFKRYDQFPNTYEDNEWLIELPAIATNRVITAQIVNRGEIDIYPTIHIYNSANTTGIALLSDSNSITITNETTGAKITLEYTPEENEEITIDIERRKIISSTHGNIINSISDDTVLSDFKLIKGDNTISCENLSGSTQLSAIVEFSNKYGMAVIG